MANGEFDVRGIAGAPGETMTMLYHILISTMVAVLAAGVDEAPGKMKAEVGEAVRGYGTPRSWDVNGRPADGNDTPTVNAVVDRYGLDVLPELRPFMQEPDRSVQSGVSSALDLLARKAETPDERKQLADEVLRWFCDPKCQEIVVLVKIADEIGSQYYSDELKDGLHDRLAASLEKSYGQERVYLVRMAGIVDLKEALPLLGEQAFKEFPHDQSIVKAFGGGGRLHWDALRARARMGVKEDIQLCLQFAEATTDQAILAGFIFEQLAYLRQPEIVEYLKPFAFRDDAAVKAEHDIVEALYCDKAVEALAYMIEGFPLQPGLPPMEGDVERCREWLRNHPKYTLRR